MKGLASIIITLLIFATPAFAEGDPQKAFIYQWVNLVLILGILFFVARKPIRAYLAVRRHEIQENLGKSASLLEEAEERLSSWQKKIEVLDSEMEEIRSSARTRAEAEREEILRQAGLMAERIQNDARMVIEQELLRARNELREEAVTLAIDLAAKLIEDKVTDDDRVRLMNEFIQRIESLPTSGESAGKN